MKKKKMKLFYDLTVKIGQPVQAQLDNFVIKKKQSYRLCIELIKTSQFHMMSNHNVTTLDALIEESNAELVTIFNYIKLNQIKKLQLTEMAFLGETWRLLGSLIQYSDLYFVIFDKVNCSSGTTSFIPYIICSKLKSFTWVNSFISDGEISDIMILSYKNYYLQNIMITNSEKLKPVNLHTHYISYNLERNHGVATDRFITVILLLLSNRFCKNSILSMIPVDVFRIIAKIVYNNFIDWFAEQDMPKMEDVD